MREFFYKFLKLNNIVLWLVLIGIVSIIPMWSGVTHAGITQLTNDAYKDVTPAWSPDGSKIAFASNRSGDYDIYVINPDGTGLTNLTNTTNTDEKYPSWNPDGTTIVYTKYDSTLEQGWGGYQLCEKNIAAGGETTLMLPAHIPFQDPQNPQYQNYWQNEIKLPVWSPDGSQIAFVSFGPDGGNYKIYTYTMPGGTIAEVTPSKDEQNSFGDIYRILWSGSVITYDRYPIGIQTFVPNSLNPQESGHSQYQVLIPGGQTPQQEENTPTEPTWSPDGKKLLFTRGAFYQSTDSFAVFEPSKGLMVPLDQVVTNSTWGSWNPDGTKLAFVHDISGNSDIWITTLPELPSTSRISGTYTVFEYERGFSGGTDASWGNTTSQLITKSLVTFNPDGTCTSSWTTLSEQHRTITEDTQSGDNIFTTTQKTDTGTDTGTYFVSSDGTVTLVFVEDGVPESNVAHIGNNGNTIIFGEKECDQTNHKCNVHMGIGVKQGSEFNKASLNGTYIVGEFGSGFSGGHTETANWGATDNSFVSRHVIVFDGAGGFTVTNPEENEIHRNIDNTQGQTGDNIFTTTTSTEPDEPESGTYTVSTSGMVTLNFTEGSIVLYLSADGNAAVFAESEFDNDDKSCDLNIGFGIKQGSNMGISDLKGTYELGEFETEFHGQVTMSAGWGAWDSEMMSKNIAVFDGAGHYTLSYADFALQQEISEASVTGGPFLNSYKVEEPWQDISGSDTGTYTVSPDGVITLNYIEDGRAESLTAYLSTDKNTIVWGESLFNEGNKEATNTFGAGIKKADFQLFAKGNINGTDGIDLEDAIQALKVASGLFPTDVYFGADSNGDGKIGMEEAIYVLQTMENLR